jgi:hypothetical protein
LQKALIKKAGFKSQISELKEFAAKEKLEIVQPACRQAGPKGSLLRAGGRGVWGGFRQLKNAAFCTITRQYSPIGLRFLKTAKEPEKISARTSFLAKSRLPSFFNLIDFIKFVSIFMKG